MYGEALELPLESLLSYVWGDSRKVMESLSSGFGETLEWLWGEARYGTGGLQNVGWTAGNIFRLWEKFEGAKMLRCMSVMIKSLPRYIQVKC